MGGFIATTVSEEQIRKLIKEEIDQSNFKGNFDKEKFVFVSHSFVEDDAKKSEALQKILKKYSIESYLAELDPQYGYLLSKKIQENIQKSMAVVVILTENSISSASVNQEIGYALGLGMTIIPLVSEKVKNKIGVLIKDVEGAIFVEGNFEEKCEEIAKFISKQIQTLQKSPATQSFEQERGDF